MAAILSMPSLTRSPLVSAVSTESHRVENVVLTAVKLRFEIGAQLGIGAASLLHGTFAEINLLHFKFFCETVITSVVASL